MILAIRYSATYSYAERASFSPHVVRLFPRQDLNLRVDQMTFSAGANSDIQYRHDLFGNLVAVCFFPDPMDCLDFQLSLTVRLEPKNPFHFLVDRHALNIPFTYKEEEVGVLSPYTIASGCELPEALRKPPTPKPAVEALIDLNTWIFKNIAYERREEGDAHPPEFILRERRGACRDSAALLVEVLRQQGLAARLVSGFLWEGHTAEGDRRAENALHAWVETYLPGAGWIGMDPTNGILCDHHFLAAAAGRNPAQIAPVEGHYFGKKTIESSLATALTIQHT